MSGKAGMDSTTEAVSLHRIPMALSFHSFEYPHSFSTFPPSWRHASSGLPAFFAQAGARSHSRRVLMVDKPGAEWAFPQAKRRARAVFKVGTLAAESPLDTMGRRTASLGRTINSTTK